MTFKLHEGTPASSGKIAEGDEEASSTASVKGGNSAQVTFVLPNDAAADKFAEQLKDTAKAAVTPPLIGWAMGRKKPHIDWPEVESVAYERHGAGQRRGWDSTTSSATRTSRSRAGWRWASGRT